MPSHGRRRDGVPARVGRGRSRGGARQRARAARTRAPAAVARGREGRRLRPRRGRRRPGRARGRRRLARVALVEEGVELRDAGIDAPILVLSEPVPDAADDASSRYRLTPVVYTLAGIDALAKAVADATARRPLARAPQGRHRHAPRRAASPTTRSSSPRRSSTGPSCGSPACARTSPSPTSPATRTPPSSSRASTPCSPTLRARAICRPASCTRATPRARSTCPDARYDMVRVGIGMLRHRARAARSTAAVDAAARAVGEGARLARADAPGGRRAVVRACATRPRTRRGSRPFPIGYADGVPRELAHHGGEVLDRAAGAARSPEPSRWTS